NSVPSASFQDFWRYQARAQMARIRMSGGMVRPIFTRDSRIHVRPSAKFRRTIAKSVWIHLKKAAPQNPIGILYCVKSCEMGSMACFPFDVPLLMETADRRLLAFRSAA